MKKIGATPVRSRKKVVKEKKPYCGAKPLKKSQREGTFEECYRKGQLRLWKKIKVNLIFYN